MAKGVDVLIKVNTGTDQSPVWTDVAGQREATFKEKVEEIETSHKLSGGYKTYEYGLTEWSIECGGIVVFGDDAWDALRNAIKNKQKIKAHWVENGGKTYEGNVLVTELSIESPYDDTITYSCTLLGDGPYTEITS